MSSALFVKQINSNPVNMLFECSILQKMISDNIDKVGQCTVIQSPFDTTNDILTIQPVHYGQVNITARAKCSFGATAKHDNRLYLGILVKDFLQCLHIPCGQAKSVFIVQSHPWLSSFKNW